MAHQVRWNKKVLEKFIDEAMLSPLDESIMRSRVRGDTRSKQCRDLHISAATLDRHISDLKKKYDEVQKQYPDELPIRKTSPAEDYMDQN